MFDSLFERDFVETPHDRTGWQDAVPPWRLLRNFRLHSNPAINELLTDRARKSALADEFSDQVNRRIAEGNLTAEEIRNLFNRARELRKICVADEQPYDPMGKKVIAAVSFNGSFQLITALIRLQAYCQKHHAPQAAPKL